MRSYPSLEKFPVNDPRGVRVPAILLGKFGLYIVINQVRNQNPLLSPAIAILVNVDPQPVYGGSRQHISGILLNCSNHSGAANPFAYWVVFPPEELPAVWPEFPFRTPQTTPLISQTH